jgi:lipoprotein-anchoring transpeptidase ErfK/SrfK
MADIFSVYNWQSYVGDAIGIWVSFKKQELVLISDNKIVQRYRCSTALAGAGNRMDSGRTPLGWHTIGAKIGDGLEMGAVLKDRQWTGEIWREGQQTDADLMLSRILWLEGLEDGKNRGGDVDSWSRYIYIHGTNQIDDLGKPRSGGCVRLDPQEVIDLYERVEVGCCVLITAN